MGLAIFLISAFMIAQRGFGCIKHNPENKQMTMVVSAAIAGFLGALLHGMFDYIWYNYRVFFMFWVVAAVMCAFGEVYPKRARDPELDNSVHMEREASLDIIFGRKRDV